MLILVLAAFGLAVLAVGIVAVWFVWRVVPQGQVPPKWNLLRWIVVGVGLFMAICVLAWPTAFGYPYRAYPEGGPESLGRVVGMPFMEAWFDSEGADYSGPLTLPAAIANAVAWFLIPHIALAAYGRAHRNRRRGA